MTNDIPFEDRKPLVSIPETWKKYLAVKDCPFASSDEMLAIAKAMFDARETLEDFRPGAQDYNAIAYRQNKRAVKKLEKLWHKRLKLSAGNLEIARLLTSHRLNSLEKEIVIVCLLSALGMFQWDIETVSEVISKIRIPSEKKLSILRTLGPGGRLRKSNLIFVQDEEELLKNEEISLSMEVVEAALSKSGDRPYAYSVKSEKELYASMGKLFVAFGEKCDLAQRSRDACFSGREEKMARRIHHLVCKLEGCIHVHPGWKISILRKRVTCKKSWTILLVLLMKTLGYGDERDFLFKGKGLAACIKSRHLYGERLLDFIRSDSLLLKNDYVRPCNGDELFLSNETDALLGSEYELSDGALEILRLQPEKLPNPDKRIRTPDMSMDRIILPAGTKKQVDIALCQSKGAKTLFDHWGLGKTFSYGRGLTLLFYGPPGTGKTATAEAIAHELGRGLLVADYSRIQNCFIGQTEKNIVDTFNTARKWNSVLFWDEADAMFFDRDTAERTWEVRDVNVLLQQIERFDGVCILAANRRMTMDKALDRRISLKVEFPRPDRACRRNLWKVLIPQELPVDPSVDLERLSRYDLSGAEIKNVIMNAARTAFARSVTGPVTMDDFLTALEYEEQGSWADTDGRRTVGFVFDRTH